MYIFTTFICSLYLQISKENIELNTRLCWPFYIVYATMCVRPHTRNLRSKERQVKKKPVKLYLSFLFSLTVSPNRYFMFLMIWIIFAS